MGPVEPSRVATEAQNAWPVPGLGRYPDAFGNRAAEALAAATGRKGRRPLQRVSQTTCNPEPVRRFAKVTTVTRNP